MEELKIGDVVFLKTSERFSGKLIYIRSIVIRLTKTRAILENGTQLINEQTKGCGDTIGYTVYGDRYKVYQIQTDKDAEIINKWEEEQKIINWWLSNRDNFTVEQVKQIHSLLK